MGRQHRVSLGHVPMPDEPIIPETGNAIGDPHRQVVECLAQCVTDPAVEKSFEDQAMTVCPRRRVLLSVAVAQLSLGGKAGPAQLIAPGLPVGDTVEPAVDRPMAGSGQPRSTFVRRVHGSGAVRRLSTGTATRNLLM